MARRCEGEGASGGFESSKPSGEIDATAYGGPFETFVPISVSLCWTPMPPTLILGPPGSPFIEFMSRDIEPLVILMMQTHAPLGEQTLGSVWSFVSLDTLHLDADSTDFFAKLEDICRQVVAGRLTRFDVAQIPGSEFDGYLHRYLGDGSITTGARAAAEQFLEFLGANPDRWPPAELIS